MDEEINENTEGELNLYKWQMGYSGSFFRNLFTTMTSADSQNLTRLGKAFPEEVEAYRRYGNEAGYWEDLQKRIKGIK